MPAHAPAPWTITADGVTEAVGPLALPATLAPGTVPTVADVEKLTAVEKVGHLNGACLVRVPGWQLMLWTAGLAGGATCSGGEIFAVASTGPGAATAGRGVQVGQLLSAAQPLFPRVPKPREEFGGDDTVALSGPTPVPWAWQTLVNINPRTGKMLGFLTSTSKWGE